MSKSASGPEVRMWLADPLGEEAARVLERTKRLPDVRRIAVMPDVHAGEDVCVGCVIGTRTLVYPRAVGGDIGCGMTAVALDGDAAALNAAPRRALECLAHGAPILKHRVDDAAWTEDAPDLDALSADRLTKAARRDGLLELGTLGRGNHFLELQRDAEGAPWLMVHSGSRAMGREIFTHHERLAATNGSPRTGRMFGLDAGTQPGEAYLRDAEWAVKYAAASRRRMLACASDLLLAELGLSARWDSLIDTAHNFVRLESHRSEILLVHRKGASPAFTGQLSVIPGSAGTFSVHAEGRGCEHSMCSSGHGAGRVMSRSEARHAISPTQVRRQLDGVCVDERMLARLAEEAPGAYRDLRRVLEAERDLVKSVRKLSPIASHKGV